MMMSYTTNDRNPLAAPPGWGRDDLSASDALSLVGADESLCASHDAGASLDNMTAAVAAEESRRAEDAVVVTRGHDSPPMMAEEGVEHGVESLIDFFVVEGDDDAAFEPPLSHPLRHHATTVSTSTCYHVGSGGSASSGSSGKLPTPRFRQASALALDNGPQTAAARDPTTTAASAQVVLGRGISATVRLCEQGGQQLAVKTIFTAANDECRDAAASEAAFAKRAAAVSNRLPPAAEGRVWEHLARVHRVAQDRVSGEATVYMEPVLGGSLRDLSLHSCTASPFPSATLRTITRQLLRGLRAMHEDLSTLHNDVKLENVLLTDSSCGPDTTVKLIDFGCASVLPEGPLCDNGSNASTANTCTSQRGSLPTMAPERLRGDAHGTKADVWSVGVAVLEMAAGGAHPFLPATGADATGGSSNTFWKLAATLKFTEGPDACRTATRDAVSAALDASPLATDGAFRDFVSKALDADVASRASTSELLAHAWLASR